MSGYIRPLQSGQKAEIEDWSISGPVDGNALPLARIEPTYPNRAALRAIERWKYNPRIVNGKAVKMTGLRTRFSFSLRE
ncbi:MAG: energy transducer TonB [Gammaproteobacteria bacterium]|nr:energy transducer TonB [Gammaproteobacteria bacterium]